MIRQLIRSYVGIVAVAIALFTVPVAFTLTDQLRDDTADSVEREADTMALLLGNGNPSSCAALAEMADAYRGQTLGTVQVTEHCDTDLLSPKQEAALGKIADPDAALTKALKQGETTTDWGSSFIWGPQLEITVPARESRRDLDGHNNGPVVGAVRIVYLTDDMTSRLWQIWGFRAGSRGGRPRCGRRDRRRGGPADHPAAAPAQRHGEQVQRR